MKTKYLIALGAILTAQAVAAVTPPPPPPLLLEKITTPGNIAPTAALSKSCVIQKSGNLVMSYNLGGLTSTRKTLLKLNFLTIISTIDKAALGTLTTGASTADTGRIEYNAYQKQLDGSMKKIVLWQEGGIAPAINDAPEATLLRSFIDLNCGN
jgi:hypothetical protein